MTPAVARLITAARAHLEAGASHPLSCLAWEEALSRARPAAVLGGHLAIPEPDWARCDCRVRELAEAIKAVEREDTG